MRCPAWQTTWDELVAAGIGAKVDADAPVLVIVPGVGEFAVYAVVKAGESVALCARRAE